MKEIINSIHKWLEDRMTSPLYGTFIFSVIFWNWKFFYVLFWQNQTSLYFPKIEYIEKVIFNNQTYFSHLTSFIVLPSITTFVIIWWLPVIANLAHAKNSEFHNKRSIAYQKNEQLYLKQLAEIKQEQAESKKEIELTTTDEERWEKEYETFKTSPRVNEFKTLIETVYGQNGYYIGKDLGTDILAIADSLGLISIIEDELNNSNKINFTPKGKFFANKYLAAEIRPEDIPF